MTTTLRLGALLTALAVAAVAIPSLALANAPTGQECKDAWNDSSARDSCGTYYSANGRELVDTSRYHVVASNGACAVSVHCRQHNTFHRPIANSFTGTTAEVESLNNCGGHLQTSSC